MSGLNKMLDEYNVTLDIDLNLEIDGHTPTNIALRFSTGEELLIAIIDTGREMSIDIDGFRAGDDAKLTTFMFKEKGYATDHVDNLKTIVMMVR